MLQNQAKIDDLVIPIVESKGAFLVEILVRGERTGKVVEIYVDTVTGVTTELCAEISREVSELLDEADLIQGKYHLVVSSPGLDRPLKLLKQYQRNIGRKVSVAHRVNGETKKTEGELTEATAERVVVRTADKVLHEIPFTEIAETFVVPRW